MMKRRKKKNRNVRLGHAKKYGVDWETGKMKNRQNNAKRKSYSKKKLVEKILKRKCKKRDWKRDRWKQKSSEKNAQNRIDW